MGKASLRLLSVWLLASAAAVCLAVPDILIFRLNNGAKNTSADIPICDAIANEFQAGGRVNPIVWDITDPIFRAAVDSGKIPRNVQFPTLEQARDVAGKLKAEYILAIDVRPGEAAVLGAAFLYSGAKLLWRDPDNDLTPVKKHYQQLVKQKKMTQAEYELAIMNATMRSSSLQLGAEFGMQDTVKSLARTWVQQIVTGPFQGLVPQTVKQTPDPAQGQQPVLPPDVGTVAPPADNRWQGEFAAAVKAGDMPRGIGILRDAVDADPLDPARRVALVKALISSGRPLLAANEARHAAELMPDRVELRVWAARAWMAAGENDEAQEDLNEAVARAPESAETRMLLADVAIATGAIDLALEHLDKVLAAAPSGDAFFKRSLAYALNGDDAKSEAEMAKAVQAGLSADPEEVKARYALVVRLWDDTMVQIGGDIRTLHQRALVQRKEKDVAREFASIRKKVDCRGKFISAISPPKAHETSHARRVLAYKLLSQCLLDLDAYLKSGNEDLLTDSRINLGEALKQSASARQGFLDEQQGVSNVKPGGPIKP